ncbi:hypothetical protein PIB30_064951 [Stylosanthes scabra]|uniref:DUF3444 domain-containing protein n=1 Tax=Stylosanthes scabra TaxID=79078 RepID=A0ABU6RMZ6_9FABA|nr:hypothetical protein [Stylosanthes scabra]
MWGASILMLSEEYNAARKKLLNAQKLYPEFGNINLMLTICDILLLASNVRLSSSGNEIHLDDVLDVIYPSATYSDARSYLHNLVTLINGIKDEFPGSELALEIVNNALNLASEKEKHFHDHCFREKIVHVSWNNEILNGESTESASTSEKDFPNLEDQECQQQFYNFEEERDANLFEPNQIWATHYQHDEGKLNQCPYAKINLKNGDFLGVTWLKPAPFDDDERMFCNADFPLACGAFRLDTNACDDHVRTKTFSYKCCWIAVMSGQNQYQIEIYPKRGEIWAVYKDGVLDDWSSNPEELKRKKLGFIEMFSDYSRCEGGDFVPLEKVNGFCSVFKRVICGRRKSPTLFHVPPQKTFLFSHKIPSHRLIGGREEALFELDQMALPKNLIFKDTTNNPSDVGEKSLSKCEFSTGQVWAIYCGKDMMPHQYVLVNSVISDKHISVTFLEHELENSEKRFIACGMFKPCNSKALQNISQFSHLVNYGSTRPQQHYMIYPNKGEIWAVYKNWGHADNEKSQCGMVEIISDFSKENGIRVAKLEEVHNCVTFFCRKQCEGFDICFTVYEADMHRFSHQVVAYRVPGIEMYGISEDSWHLEPQAIPNH